MDNPNAANRPSIPADMMEQFETEYAELLRRRNWTSLRMVQMGAVVGGVRRVIVPEANRRAPFEVYFTELDGSGYGTAINASSGAPVQYGLLIHIGHPPTDKDRWHVYQRVVTSEIDQVTNEPGTVQHASQHTLRNVGFDGGSSIGYVGQDPVFIDDRQFVSLNILPDTGTTVRLTPGWINFIGLRQWFTGSIIDLTTSIPADAGKARYVLIEIDGGLVVYTTEGTEYNYNLPANPLSYYVPAGTSGRFPIGAVCLRNGTTQLNWSHIWVNMGLRSVGAVMDLGDLVDVDLSTNAPEDGQILVWDATNSEWIPGTGGGWVVDYSAIIPTGKDAFIPGAVTVTSAGTLTVDGDLYVV